MKKLLTSLFLTTGFLFAAEQGDVPTNEESSLSYYSLKLGSTTHEIPVLTLEPEEQISYQQFLRRLGNPESASQVVQAAKSVITTPHVSASDFLKFMQIIHRFATVEAAKETIGGAPVEAQNDPEKLASALGMNLSLLTLKFSGMDAIETPFQSLTAEENNATYPQFFQSKNPQSASEIVKAAKSVITTPYVSGSDFLKFMKIIDRFATVEAAKETIGGAPAEAQNDPEKLASALGMNLSYLTLKFSGMDAIEIPVENFTAQEKEMYQNFFNSRTAESTSEIVKAAKSMFTSSPISGTAFLNYVKIIDRFATVEAAKETIGGVPVEAQNDPEKLASALGMNLSHLTLKFTEAGSIEIPVNSANFSEADGKLYKDFFTNSSDTTVLENFNNHKQTVELVKSVLTAPTVSAACFFKFLQLAQELKFVEGLGGVFASISKEDIQDDADKLAFALQAQADESIEKGCRAYFLKKSERGAYHLETTPEESNDNY